MEEDKCEHCGEPLDKDGYCKNADECSWCDWYGCVYDEGDHGCDRPEDKEENNNE